MSAVVYEVTLRVRPQIACEFRDWLHVHAGEMLALPGFLDARVSELDPAEPGAVVFCCHYRLRDAGALHAYLRDHAPRMRDDGVRRFADGFSAERRILRILADYAASAPGGR